MKRLIEIFEPFNYTGLSHYVIKIPVTTVDKGKTRAGEIKLPDHITDLKGYVITSTADTKGLSKIAGRIVMRFNEGAISPIHAFIPDKTINNYFDNPVRLNETLSEGSVMQGFYQDYNNSGLTGYVISVYLLFTNKAFSVKPNSK